MASRLARNLENSWIVACPIYANHLIVLAPASSAAASEDAVPPIPLTSTVGGCWEGVSNVVPLRDTATAYAQAFHALAAARHRTERRATFACSPDLVLTLGPTAASWAGSVLAPLRGHRARRAQDPCGRELAATAASWLRFASHAAAHLKIHRNTLSARIRQISELLGLDLNQLAGQAILSLALRVDAAPIDVDPAWEGSQYVHRGVAHALNELLVHPAVVEWAWLQFTPVHETALPSDLAATLDSWLRHDAQVGATATALSLSPSAVRKRLTRTEALLERSLLRSPDAVHDLWIALHTLDLTKEQLIQPNPGTHGALPAAVRS
ncbi:helix-turn-helix domain-containing protein [Streptomyces sp. WAC07061]|uniref:helix-turn-helix domain-containing protein n=1 Tax=Streptomyces sp. WAC07061 TaxID=2487410 RepID=UPI0021B06F60|nr:helix-turn-helix domain-containing protein [Streptomyces sp. WAC07061]